MDKERENNLTRTAKYKNLASEENKNPSSKETKTPIISVDEFKSLNETKELFDLGIDDLSLEKTKSQKVLEEEQIKMFKQNKNNKLNKEPENKTKKKKKKLKKGSIINIIITLCIIGAIGVFIYSSIDIYKWHKDNEQIEKITDEIIEKVTVTDINPDDEVLVEESEEPRENPYWDYIKMSMIDVNMDELKSTNSEAIGWIQVNGTNINYPFVQTDNNDYYLTHAFNKSYNNAGWVFLDYRNNANDLDRNTVIYAHGRWDKTMFGSLKNLLNTNWYNNLDNHVIKVYINGRSTLWQVFSVYHIPTTNDYIQVSFNSDESFKQFVDMLQQRSYYKFNTSVSATDKIITLSTCYNDQEKMVMHAKLIKYTN